MPKETPAMPLLQNHPSEQTKNEDFVQNSINPSLPVEDETASSQAVSTARPSASAWSRPIHCHVSISGLPWLCVWEGFFTGIQALVLLAFGGVMVGGMAGFAALTGQPFALALALMGTVLLLLIVQIRMTHQQNFTGQRPSSWAISWIFRAVMFYAFFCVLDAIRQKTWQGLDNVILSTISATGSLALQYVRQKKQR